MYQDQQPTQAPGGGQLHPLWSKGIYTFRKRLLNFIGIRLDIFDAYKQTILHCHQKAFRLREDIRLHEGSARGREVLAINARQIIDFSAAYDVVDQETGEWIGTLRRKGWHSMIRDLWEILDTNGTVIGQLQEDSWGGALLRRFLTNLIPQRFHVVTVDGRFAANLDQAFNPFVYWLTLEIPPQPLIDPRLLVATATLVATIEGRQG